MSEEAVQAAGVGRRSSRCGGRSSGSGGRGCWPEAPVDVECTRQWSLKPEAPAAVVETVEAPVEREPVRQEDVSYQAVEKEGTVTAIWEMQGQKHLRTIDPRSIEGKQILALFETAAG